MIDRELTTCRKQVATLKSAIKLQIEICETLRGRASVAISAKLRPFHKQQTERIIAAVRELLAANWEHRELYERCEVAGVTPVNMPPLFFAFDRTGDPRDIHSVASMYFRECVEHGYLKQSEV